ncbi:MAG: hypothetical protein E6J34_20720 [Chloroflexi bacterium]|nr:MAG: hypothetical protein E6J34_20720 [Chloroflexota bacterium]
MRRYISRGVVWFGLFFLVVVLVAAQFWHSASYKQMVPSCTDALSMQQTSPMTSKDMRTVPPLYLGLDAYRHWDKLSYLEVGDRVEGWSSADPGGTNHDNKHIVRKLPNGERVLFDQVGPGIVTFMRMQQAIGAPWQLTVDDRTSTFSRNDLGQPDPTGPPSNAFAYPLSLNPDESHGSSILASAIPFEQKLTWTAYHDNGNFYALYRKLPYGTPLTAWNSQTDNSDVVRLLRCSGSDIAPGRISQQSGEFAPVGGTETSLVTLHGQQQIRALTLQVPARDMIELGNARLLIREFAF